VARRGGQPKPQRGATYQPRATPWEQESPTSAMKGRDIQRLAESPRLVEILQQRGARSMIDLYGPLVIGMIDADRQAGTGLQRSNHLGTELEA